MNKNCKQCNKTFIKKYKESLKYWNTKSFCSYKCYWSDKKGKIPSHLKLWEKGVHISPKTEFKKGQISIRKGMQQPQSQKQIEKRMESLARGENHWNWKGGVNPINDTIRKSFEYKKWRKQVFERDGWTCVNCSYRSKGKDIRADHIKPFSLFPELRFATNNGRTLCVDCDKILGWNFRRNKNQFIVGQNIG